MLEELQRLQTRDRRVTQLLDEVNALLRAGSGDNQAIWRAANDLEAGLSSASPTAHLVM